MLFSRQNPFVLQQRLRECLWCEARCRILALKEEVSHIGGRDATWHLALAPSLHPTNSPSHEKRKNRKKKKKRTAVLAHHHHLLQTWAKHCERTTTLAVFASPLSSHGSRWPRSLTSVLSTPTGRPRQAHLGPQQCTPEEHCSAVPARPRLSPIGLCDQRKPGSLSWSTSHQKSSTWYSQ